MLLFFQALWMSRHQVADMPTVAVPRSSARCNRVRGRHLRESARRQARAC
jgi:hypothetical protein